MASCDVVPAVSFLRSVDAEQPDAAAVAQLDRVSVDHSRDSAPGPAVLRVDLRGDSLGRRRYGRPAWRGLRRRLSDWRRGLLARLRWLRLRIHGVRRGRRRLRCHRAAAVVRTDVRLRRALASAECSGEGGHEDGRRRRPGGTEGNHASKHGTDEAVVAAEQDYSGYPGTAGQPDAACWSVTSCCDRP